MDIFDANCRDKFHWTLKISFIAQRTRIFLLIKIKQLIMGGRRGGKERQEIREGDHSPH